MYILRHVSIYTIPESCPGCNGSVPKSVSGKNPLKFVNFKCHCKFNVLFLIVL